MDEPCQLELNITKIKWQNMDSLAFKYSEIFNLFIYLSKLLVFDYYYYYDDKCDKKMHNEIIKE